MLSYDNFMLVQDSYGTSRSVSSSVAPQNVNPIKVFKLSYANRLVALDTYGTSRSLGSSIAYQDIKNAFSLYDKPVAPDLYGMSSWVGSSAISRKYQQATCLRAMLR